MEGGCACGEVRYALRSEPMFVQACHCRDCQRQTGGPFAVNALIETDQIARLRGEPRVVAMPSPSGRGHEVHRCPTCQVAVWSDYGRRPAIRFVRVTTLDNADAVAPDVHIFTRSKLAWVRLPESARAFEVYYDMGREWSAQSLARWRVALGDG